MGLVLAHQGGVSRVLLGSGSCSHLHHRHSPHRVDRCTPLLSFCPLCLNLKAPHTQHARERARTLPIPPASRAGQEAGAPQTAPRHPRFHQRLHPGGTKPCPFRTHVSSASPPPAVRDPRPHSQRRLSASASVVPAHSWLVSLSLLCAPLSVCPVSHTDPHSLSPAPEVSARLHVTSRAWPLRCFILAPPLSLSVLCVASTLAAHWPLFSTRRCLCSSTALALSLPVSTRLFSA